MTRDACRVTIAFWPFARNDQLGNSNRNVLVTPTEFMRAIVERAMANTPRVDILTYGPENSEFPKQAGGNLFSLLSLQPVQENPPHLFQ